MSFVQFCMTFCKIATDDINILATHINTLTKIELRTINAFSRHSKHIIYTIIMNGIVGNHDALLYDYVLNL